MTMTSKVPRSKFPYIFLKLQVVALCAVAVWILYSPPSLEYVKFSGIRPKKQSIISSNYYSRGEGLRLFQSSRQRDVGAEDRSLTSNDAGTSPLGGHQTMVDGTPTEEVTSGNMNWTLPDDSEDGPSEKRKWIIKWEDRDLENTEYLPLRNKTGLGGGEEGTPLEKDRVIFNRVGKCGSRSVLTLLDRLARANQFYLVSSQTFNQKHIGAQSEEKLVSILNMVDGPFIYQRHLHYIDFTKYGGSPPTYINIIRDPLERAVSQYYFIRFGDEKKQERKFSQNSTDPRKYMSYEECVQRRMNECVGKKAFYIVPFFCGQDKKCTYPSLWAYTRAKENVENSYLAVGVLEELQDTLRVFERVLPRLFQGALRTYIKFEQIEHAHNKSSVGVTKYKQRPSEQVAKYMRGVVMKYEYLFYDWIRERLHRQMKDLGVASHHDDHR